jgi:tetratricopeptide (TPR) repeat protein
MYKPASLVYGCARRIDMRRARFSPFLVTLLSLSSVAFAEPKAGTPSAGELVNRGVEVARTGEYDAAIHNFDEAIRIDPKFVPAYDNRGTIEMAKGDLARAIADYDQAIRLDPKDSRAFGARGLAYEAKGDFTHAIADYDKAIQIEPQFARVYYNRGIVYGKKGDYRRAVADFQEAIRLDPNDPSPYNSAAWLLASCSADNCRDGAKAVELATKACSLTAWKNPDYLDTIGVAYAEIGDFDQAIKFEKQALQFPQWAEKQGDGAQKRLDLYKERKPYREKTP